MAPVTPAFAAQYAASIGSPRVAAAEATATKRPARGSGRRSSAGMPTLAATRTDRRFASSTASCWAAGISHSGTPSAYTRDRDHRVHAPELALGRADGALHVLNGCGIAYQRSDRSAAAGARDDLLELLAGP